MVDSSSQGLADWLSSSTWPLEEPAGGGRGLQSLLGERDLQRTNRQEHVFGRPLSDGNYDGYSIGRVRSHERLEMILARLSIRYALK